MKQTKLTIEEMRYKVPKVSNRFWQVHTRFILSCFAAFLIIILTCLTFVIVNGIQKFIPKPIIIFFCEVEDYTASSESFDIYSDSIDLFFVAYDDRFDAEIEGNDMYDFSEFGERVSEIYRQYGKSVLCITLTSMKSVRKTYWYNDFNLENEEQVSVEIIEKIVKEALGKI